MRNKRFSARCYCSFLALFLLIMVPTLSWAEEQEADSEWYLDAHARSIFEYNVIQGGLLDGEEDQEFQQFLDLYATRSKAGRTYAVSFFGTYRKNFSDPEPSSFYYDSLNTMDNSEVLNFYQGYIDAKNPFGPDVLGFRVGRQSFWGADAIRFDGGRIYLQDTGFNFLRINGFVGQYVSIWDDDPPDEVPWGGSIELLMWPGCRIFSSMIHFLDYTWNVEMRQVVGANFFGEVEYRGINGYSRDLSADAMYTISPINMTLLGGYYKKFGADEDEESYDEFLFDYASTDNNATDYNEYRLQRLLFTPIAGHSEYSLDLEVGFLANRIVPGVGFMRHQLDDSNDEDYYNADYNMYRASFDIRDLPFQRFTMVVRWEHTEEDRDIGDEEAVMDNFWAFAGQSFLRDQLEISASAGLKTYKYNDNSFGGQSFGGELRYNPCPFASLAVNYETIINELYEEQLGMDRIDEVTALIDLRY